MEVTVAPDSDIHQVERMAIEALMSRRLPVKAQSTHRCPRGRITGHESETCVDSIPVARGTAAKAVQVLASEGLVRIVPGRGAYVVSKPHE